MPLGGPMPIRRIIYANGQLLSGPLTMAASAKTTGEGFNNHHIHFDMSGLCGDFRPLDTAIMMRVSVD